MNASGLTPLVYHIAFAGMQGMGVDLARRLLDVVGSEQRLFDMSEKELRALTHGRSKIYSDVYSPIALTPVACWKHLMLLQ